MGGGGGQTTEPFKIKFQADLVKTLPKKCTTQMLVLMNRHEVKLQMKRTDRVCRDSGAMS